MQSKVAAEDFTPTLSPALQDLYQRVQKFASDHFKKLKDAHYIYNNTVYYHGCCNTFSTKKSKSRAGHNQSQSLSDFLAKPKSEVTVQVLADACLKASQKLPGSRCMSTPTVNQPHQDNTALDKRLAEAEAEAADSHMKPGIKMNTLNLELALLKQDKERLLKLVQTEQTAAREAERQSLIYAFFLRYNNIDPEKVLSGWSPRGGEWGEQITVRWPAFNPEED